MIGSFDTIAGALLWSKLGAAELIVGLIVGLMMLAFALPANLHGEADEDEARDARWAESRRR
jgi:hypothetical protein